MKVSVFTCAPQFENDLMDAARIFLGNQTEVLSGTEGGDITLRHAERVDGNTRICTVTLSGVYAGVSTRAETLSDDPMVDKRLRKRQAK